MKDLKIVLFDDWAVIYLNGRLVFEDHDIRYDKLLELLEIKYEQHYISDKQLKQQGEKIEYGYQPPQSFSSLKKFL